GHYKYNCPDRASTSGKGDNDKGKAPVNSFDVVDKSRNNEVDVFVTKRKKEKDNQDGNDPKKMKEETSKKHRRRKLGVQDFLISQGQGPYSILEDLSKRPANITYGQLLAMSSEKRRELRGGLNARRRKEVEVPVLEAEADPYAPQAEVLCNGISIHDVLVDGGAAVNVMTESVMNMLGLKIDRPSTLMLRSLNKGKTKPEGVISNVAISVMGVVCVVDFQVMKNGTVAYPMLLGRPWLRRVHARNYWNEGFMTLGRGRERVKINVIPRHHKAEPVDSSDETDDWTSSDYSSTSEVDTEDEE
ncbi:hypothetical protein KI387_024708, partial [Taxus chinensis]